MPHLTTCLALVGQAEEAARFYSRIFNTPVDGVMPDGQGGTMLCTLTIAGQPVVILNSCGADAEIVSQRITMQLHVDGQEESDYYWNALLADGGTPSQGGWLVDKFGVWWNIVPEQLKHLMGSATPAGMARLQGAFQRMQRIDLAELARLAEDR